MQLCQERGLIVRAIGDVIALCPPFVFNEAPVNEIFTGLARGPDDTSAGARREAAVADDSLSRGERS
jgi:4-aminobutyrate--pyruvate transaminase